MRAIIPQPDGIRELPNGVALLRRESTTRQLANVVVVGIYLQSRGWSIVDVAHLDFMDQVRLFARAENIVSVLGSGLAGLLYSPEGVKVLTLAPSNWGDLFFFSLMQERQARLADIRGLSLAETPADAAWQRFVLDIADVQTGLQALGLPFERVSPTQMASGVIGAGAKPQPQ
jgi:hypothetical protein